MKQFLLLLSFYFVCLPAFCQVDSASLKIMETIFREEQPKGTLFYVDKLNNDFIKLFKDKFRKRKIVGWIKYTVEDSILLSGKEMRYIKSAINKLSSFRWNDSLFPDSKRIPADSMWQHISKRNREFSQMVKTLPAEELRKVKGRDIFSNVFIFYWPVWLRDRSIFILFFYRMCGRECGINDLALYRLENGVYKKWMVIYGGVF